MAVSLIAIANGNLTTNTTWGTSNAGALNITGSTSVGITASYQLSSTFTPGAVTVDGIAVYVNTRPGSSGTLSIALDQGGSTVVGTEVTINVTDIPAAGSTWIMTQFTGVPLSGATLYSVKIKASGTSLVTCFATSGTNWLRQLRVPGTTATPAAGDSMYIFGEKTGASAQTTRTVTMDDAAGGATVYGVMDINSGGTLTYGTTGGVNYYLKLAGNCNVRSGGTLKIGDAAGTRIPSNSTADLKFSNSSNVDFGLVGIGSPTIITAGNNNAVPWTFLAADAAAAATSLTTSASTGWKNGDVIAIAATTTTVTQCESKALTADASGTTLTITALTSAHAGGGVTNGSDVKAELANLSRNVRISGTSTTFQAYAVFPAAATVTLDDTEFFNMGSNTAGKRGINVQTTTGSVTMNYCSIHDFVVSGSLGLFLDAAAVTNCTLSHCVFYNCASQCISANTATTNTNSITLSDVVMIRTTSSYCLSIAYNQNASSIRAVGNAGNAGIFFSGGTFTGTFTDILAHSCATACVQLDDTTTTGTITNLTCYRSVTQGLFIASGSIINGLTINGFTAFGSGSVNFNNSGTIYNMTVISGDLRAGLNLTCPAGFQQSSTYLGKLIFVNSVFGGSSQTHASEDILINAALTNCIFFLLDNCTLASSTQVAGPQNLLNVVGRQISMIRANFLGATQAHKTWLSNGTWSYDSATAVVSPSLRLTPTSASSKLQSPSFYKSVLSGQTVTASVAVRTSLVASGDAQTYNGNAPRLIARRNYGAGITSDQVLAIASGASSGAFETISGATTAVGANCALEFYVDCDGTQGWVNVDSLSLLAA